MSENFIQPKTEKERVTRLVASYWLQSPLNDGGHLKHFCLTGEGTPKLVEVLTPFKNRNIEATIVLAFLKEG